MPPLLLLSPRAGEVEKEREEERKAEEEEEKEDGDEKGLSLPLSSPSSLSWRWREEERGVFLSALQTRQRLLPGGLGGGAARARGERGLTVAAPTPSLSSAAAPRLPLLFLSARRGLLLPCRL